MSEKLTAELIVKIEGFTKGMRLAAAEAQRTGNIVDKATDSISSAITSKMAGVFSIAAITTFGKAVLDVTAEFQKFNAVLTNTLGSSALANLKMREIQDFAAQTPFGVNELTGAFVKLANAGFRPTGEQMRKLGDLASSTGKSFDQLAEAILDAQTGEFERLKEFGVRAKDAGDSVIFTYKGVQTQVDKTSGSIRDYITNLGDAQGVSGSMAKISETLGGKISNLGDSWDQMLISVGSNTSGVFSSAIDVIGKTLNKITQYNNELNKVSKYKLGSASGDFLKQVNRAINPFASKVATDLESQVYNINKTEKALGEYVSKTIASAKSTADFGKALADLKQKADLTKGLTSVSAFTQAANKSGLKGSILDISKTLPSDFTNTKAEAKAIQEVYQESVNAIIDARRNFIQQSKTPDANFGTSKVQGSADKIAEIYKKLSSDLKSNPLDFGATKSDVAIANISSYQTAIISLIANGISPASKAIDKLTEAQNKLAESVKGKDLKPVDLDISKLLGIDETKEFTIKPKLNIKPVVVGNYSSEIDTAIADIQAKIENMTSVVGLIGEVGPLIGQGFAAIGEGLVNGANGISSFGNVVLQAFGGFLAQLGQLTITEGLFHIAKGFGYAANPLTALLAPGEFATGKGLIAAGAIASVAGGVVSGSAKKKAGGNSSVRKFASGGIISGPTMGLMGEYAGASNNPEVVAPLNTLKKYLPDPGASGQQIFIPEMRIGNDAIYVAWRRGKADHERY